jgi:hypothetical protein
MLKYWMLALGLAGAGYTLYLGLFGRDWPDRRKRDRRDSPGSTRLPEPDRREGRDRRKG